MVGLVLETVMVDLGNSNKREGWITVDITGFPNVKHDLNKFPYPFKNNSVDFVEFRETFDHTTFKPSDFVKEMRRILKPNGKIHFKSANNFHWFRRLKYLFGSFEFDDNYCLWHTRLQKFSTVILCFKNEGFQINLQAGLVKRLFPDLLCNEIDFTAKLMGWT